MLFSNEGKSKLNYFLHVIVNLEQVVNKIAVNYLSSDEKDLVFNKFRVDYNGFIEDLKYNIYYLEELLSNRINFLDNKHKEEIYSLIYDYGEDLNRIFKENELSPPLFLFRFLSYTINFFDLFKSKKEPLNFLLDNNELDVGFVRKVNNLISLKEHLNESDLKGIEDIDRFFSNYNGFDKNLSDISKKYIEIESGFKERIDNFFYNKGADFDKYVNDILLSFNKKLIEVQTPYENEIKTKISDLNSKYEESQSELITLLGNLKSYKNILSDKTQDEISKHYFLKAQSEKRMYWITTITSVVLILSSLGSVGWALYDYYQDYISITSCVGKTNVDVCLNNLKVLREASQSFGLTFFIMRFVFSLLLFLTVIYTSRIAIRAYNHWRHSENMHLKLVSLNPFIGNLDKDKRDEIHIGLVPDYFGKDAGVIEFQKDGFKDIPTNVANVAIKALEQAGGTFGGKSNTEKNDKKPDSGTE